MSKNEKTKHSFLDAFHKKGRHKGNGKSSRPTSLAEAEDVLDQAPAAPLPSPATTPAAADSLTDSDVEREFEKMLDDMNLAEAKKAPLRNQDMEKKRRMLTMHFKGATPRQRSRFVSASDYTAYLAQPLSLQKTLECLESLRIALTNNPLTWVQEFGDAGFRQLLSILSECYKGDYKWDRVQLECVRCLRSLANTSLGLRQLLGEEGALATLARSLEPRLPLVMLEVVRMLAALAIVPPDGHSRTLEAITINGETLGRSRFAPIVQGLMDRSNDQLRLCVMILINALVSSPDELDFRLHLRNEFMRDGLMDILETMDSDGADGLQDQLKIFSEHRDDDHDELCQRLETVRLELDDPEQVFSLLRNSLAQSAAEPYLLSILQHLLCIRDGPNVRLSYLMLVEECVSQIVLHKSGVDPDFRATRRFDLDVEPLIETLKERGRQEDERASGELNLKLEQMLTSKQETEAKLSAAERMITQLKDNLEKAGGPQDGKLVVPTGLAAAVGAAAAKSGAAPAGSGGIPPPPPLPGAAGIPPPPPLPGAGGIPPPPPMPGTAGIPPPPPMPGAGGIPPPPPMPGMGGIPPPPPMPGPGGIPPPPPMPGMGGIPPPPPMPGAGGIPPPPPMPGGGGPPPPPPMPGTGGPPPPPPPPGGGPPPPPGMPMMPMVPQLPHGLKPKTKWTLGQNTKRANWKKILPNNLKANSFWVKANDEALADEEILKGLQSKFSSKPPPKKSDVTENATKKKGKELRVLDGKAAQNLSILVGGSLKHMQYADVRTAVLRCDQTVLTESLVEALIQYMPDAAQLTKLEAFKEEYDQLTEAEQFAMTVGSIKRLLPRLKSLLFKLRFEEMVNDIKPNVVAATAACEEILSSEKLAHILELILLLGNYMNSGSRNSEAFGFEISFLTKLNNTKDTQNKTTLLHYLAEVVETKHPELLDFPQQIGHVQSASKVSESQISELIRKMEAGTKNLETDVKNNKVPLSDEDKFIEVMTEFSVEARQQVDVLTSMARTMADKFDAIADFFAFEKKKYTMEDFFSDMATFVKQFQDAHRDNVKLRETEAKIARAREAKAAAERERSEKVSQKQAIAAMMAEGDNQEGVMDSLLEALQSGQAFSREKRRKRAPRPAGAERRAQLGRSRSRAELEPDQESRRDRENRTEQENMQHSTDDPGAAPAAGEEKVVAVRRRANRAGGADRALANDLTNKLLDQLMDTS